MLNVVISTDKIALERQIKVLKYALKTTQMIKTKKNTLTSFRTLREVVWSHLEQ